MCEFCTQHGEGKKWYLQMENYSQELLEQDGRREYMIEFLNTFEKRVPAETAQVESFSAHAACTSNELVPDRNAEEKSLRPGGTH